MRYLMTSAAVAVAMIGGATFAKDPPTLAPKLNLKGHTKAVWCVAYSPDGKILATGGGNLKINENNPGELMLWSPATGRRIAILRNQGGRVRALAFSPDGKMLAAGYEPENLGATGQTVLWNVATRANISKKPFSSHALAYSADGQFLAMGGIGSPPPFPQGGNRFSGVEVWDVKQSVKTATLSPGSRFGVGCLAFTAEGGTLISNGLPGTVLLWDLPMGKVKAELKFDQGASPAFAVSPDGATMAVVTNNEGKADGLTLVDLEMHKELWKVNLSTRNMDVIIQTLGFSHDGKALAVGTGWVDEGDVFLMAAADGRRIAHLRGHRDMVKGVAFSADDRTLASGSTDGVVLSWDVSPKGLTEADNKLPKDPAAKEPKANAPAAKPADGPASKVPSEKVTPDKNAKPPITKIPQPELPAGMFPDSVVKFHKSMVQLREKEAVRLEERIKLLKETVRLGARDVRSPNLRTGTNLLNTLNQRLKVVKSDKPYIPRISPKDFALGQIGELDDDMQLSTSKGVDGVAGVGVKYEFLGYFTGQPGVWVHGVEVGDTFQVRADFTANLQRAMGEYNRADPSVRLLRSHVYEVVEEKPRGLISNYILAPFKMDEVNAWLRGPVETIFKNLNHAEFQKAFDKAVLQQQRPTKLTISIKNGIVVFSGTFATDYIPNRKWTCRHGLTTAKFEELNAQLTRQEYKLESHGQATHNGQEVHAAVWVPK